MVEWSLILFVILIIRLGLFLVLVDWVWFVKGCSNWLSFVENKTVWIVSKCMYCLVNVNGNLM